MTRLQIKEIIKVTGGDLVRGSFRLTVCGISTDTRTLSKGDLFIALKGEKFDGHCFLEEAFKKGAIGAIVSEDRRQRIENSNKVIIKVQNTLQALGDIAKIYREKFSKTKVIAIAGSNGKTTTKEMLGFCLSKKFNVLKAKASFNNFVGVPLTLLETKKDTQIVILEMETNLLGGIERLCEIAQPLIGLVTNVSNTHLEYLKTKRNVFREKSELIESLPSCGIALLNYDDFWVRKMKRLAKTKRIIGIGIKNKKNFWASNVRINDNSLEFILNGREKVKLKTIFYKNVYNALAVIGIAHKAFGLSLREILKSLEEFKFPPFRAEIVNFDDIKIIKDCYNANPQSVKDALNTLKNIKGLRKIAILGDMLELGREEKRFHYQIGKLCANGKIDILITLGVLAKETAKGAKDNGMKKVVFFKDKEKCLKYLLEILRRGDILLAKGSRTMKMEEIVDKVQEEVKRFIPLESPVSS